MIESKSPYPRHRRIGVLLASLILIATGCVSYDETGVIHSDGSGEVRIAIGLARDNVDHQKIEDVRRTVARLKGLRWVSTLDSSAGSRRWTGAVIHFDSVEALRPLNTVIALESLFGNISLTQTDSGTELRRSILLPPGAVDDHDFNRIRWSFPGRIVATDRHARIDSTGSGALWHLPLGDGSKKRAALMVRWTKPMLATPDWLPLVDTAVDSRFAPWLIGLQIVILIGLMLCALLVTGRLRSRVRTLVQIRAATQPNLKGGSATGDRPHQGRRRRG